MADAIQVTVTLAAEEAAMQLAHSVVEAGLATRAQVSGPVHSTFRWHGVVKEATEWHCSLNTTADRYKAVEQHIDQYFPDGIPKVVAVPTM